MIVSISTSDIASVATASQSTAQNSFRMISKSALLPDGLVRNVSDELAHKAIKASWGSPIEVSCWN